MKKRRYGLILLVLAVFGWFAGVRPQLRTFEEHSLNHKIKIEEVASYTQRLNDIELIQGQGEAVQKNLQALYLAMPSSTQIPEVLVMIEALGASTGIVFSTASVGNPTSSEVPVALTFSGSLEATTSFLNAVYSNIRAVSVKSQSLSSSEGTNLTVTMQLGLVYKGGK